MKFKKTTKWISLQDRYLCLCIILKKKKKKKKKPNSWTLLLSKACSESSVGLQTTSLYIWLWLIFAVKVKKEKTQNQMCDLLLKKHLAVCVYMYIYPWEIQILPYSNFKGCVENFRMQHVFEKVLQDLEPTTPPWSVAWNFGLQRATKCTICLFIKRKHILLLLYMNSHDTWRNKKTQKLQCVWVPRVAGTSDSYVGNTVFNKGWQRITKLTSCFIMSSCRYHKLFPLCMLLFFCSCWISVKRVLVLHGSGPPSGVVLAVLLCGASREFQQSFQAVAPAPESSMGCGWGRGAGGERSIMDRGCRKLWDSRKMKALLSCLAPAAGFPWRSGNVGNICNKNMIKCIVSMPKSDDVMVQSLTH